MNLFIEKLKEKVVNVVYEQHYHNYDENRFGKIKNENYLKAKLRKKFLDKNYVARWKVEQQMTKMFDFLPQFEGLNWLYSNLADNSSKDLLIDLFAYRIMGNSYVKLPLNTPQYWDTIEEIKKLSKNNQTLTPNFGHFVLEKYNLKTIGVELELYFTAAGIVTDFIVEQYAYKKGRTDISVHAGETVIDAGGCWGDTALYFAHKTKPGGKVLSFEFIPDNIGIFKKNMDLNPELKENVILIEHPLWSETDKNMYFVDNGPSSRVSFEKKEGFNNTVKTITIDDAVEKHNISHVDYIKMDIEGAELHALKGAEKIIKRCKPKLAISVYHSVDDFYTIAQWIDNLNLGYRFYLGHYTIHQEETILFGTTE